MARWTPERRRSFRITAGFSIYYAIFLVFIYGPMIAMFILSFQGRRGGTSFPMRGWSLYWWNKLIEPPGEAKEDWAVAPDFIDEGVGVRVAHVPSRGRSRESRNHLCEGCCAQVTGAAPSHSL